MKMLKDIQVVAYEGGQIRKFTVGDCGREAVLALPLSRLIVKMVKVPAGEDAIEVATPILKAMSPFPDDELTVGCEVVRESETGSVVVAAALPESAAEDIGEALDAEKLSITRIDALPLGLLRGIWTELISGGDANARRIVLIDGNDCLSLFVMDNDQPNAIRAVSALSDLKREVMLSLLEAEDFGGAKKIAEVVLVKDIREESASESTEGELEEFIANKKSPLDVAQVAEKLAGICDAPVREIKIEDDELSLKGIAERADEESALDAMPDSWAEVLEETRFKSNLIKSVMVACAIWALAMGVLFGVPVAYGYMTDYQKGLSKQHHRQYEAVKTMKEKTELVKKYSDHSRGALEIMKAISDRLPEGASLNSWDFKHGEYLKIKGEAESATLVYEFKDAIEEICFEDENSDEIGDRIFPQVNLSGPTTTRDGVRFDIECLCATEDAE